MKERLIMFLSILTLLSCASRSDPRLNIDEGLETPIYSVSTVEGNCEVREYQEHIVASVTVGGDLQEASSEGFRTLAGYIFGRNSEQSSIAMTSPVSVSSPPKSVRIDMTTPVTAKQIEDQGWEVTFSMPSQYTLKTLPKPSNPRIKILKQPGDRVAVIVFSGRATQSNIDRQELTLRAWIEAQGLQIDGPLVLSRYNAPFTLPWNRRNEISFKIKHL